MLRQQTIIKTLEKLNYKERLEKVREIVAPEQTVLVVVNHRIDLSFFIEIYMPLKLYIIGFIEPKETLHGEVIVEVTTQIQIKDIEHDLINLGYKNIELRLTGEIR